MSTEPSTTSSKEQRKLLQTLSIVQKELKFRQGLLYDPYQKQIEFHDAGSVYRERAFLAGNQLGKSLAGGSEAAYHATGEYPEGWRGKRFSTPTLGWVASNSNETTRDNPQRILFGPVGQLGTGTIPKRLIVDIKMARGISGLIDTATIRHKGGELSTIKFHAYEKGPDKFMGATIDWFWCDEEPPADVYSEGVTRTNAGDRGKGGIVWITATPLKGMTHVMEQFYPEPSIPTRHLTMMDIWDVGHYTDAQKQAIVDAYPAHEREARSRGIPSLGSGRVFPVAQSQLECKMFDVPSHLYQLLGADFGWEHPTAFIHAAVDRDTDTFYVVNAYKQKEQVFSVHASAVRHWGASPPVAWPHDGQTHDPGSGIQIAESYRLEGLNMMAEWATHPTGGFSTEPAIQEMHKAMATGKFKVFSHLDNWFQEFNTYHRDKEGKIVKRGDDLMSATRMAWIMRRYGQQEQRRVFAPTAERYEPFAEYTH